MHHPAPNDRVRLTQGVPTLWLQCGDVGVVCSEWLSSADYYEVEFQKPGESFGVHALIRGDQLEVIEFAPT